MQTIALACLRQQLPRLLRRARLGREKFAIAYYGQVVGFLVPAQALTPAMIARSQSVSTTAFRDELTDCWERLQAELDCVFVTSHGRRAVAFVSPRYAQELGWTDDASLTRVGAMPPALLQLLKEEKR